MTSSTGGPHDAKGNRILASQHEEQGRSGLGLAAQHDAIEALERARSSE